MKALRPYPKITITPKGEAALTGGHPWGYEGEVTAVDGTPEDGALVDVVSRRGSWLGCGFYNSHSKIRVRLLSRNANDDFSDAFWERRVRYAWDYRKTVMGETDSRCCRVIFGEADLFPGLTVDRFESVLVTQTLSLGMERIKDRLFPLLAKVLREDGQDIRGIYERNDVALREREGMAQNKGWYPLPGETPPEKTCVDITENGIVYTVDFENGQKTGFFLDQKYNRLAVAKLAKGKTVLDCFTHTGSFALNAARGGAVVGICGGYQMLGRTISDPHGVENENSLREPLYPAHCEAISHEPDTIAVERIRRDGALPLRGMELPPRETRRQSHAADENSLREPLRGMELIDTDTTLMPEKMRTQTRGKFENVTGIFSTLSGLEFSGYEIHMGKTTVSTGEHQTPLVQLADGRTDGVQRMEKGSEEPGVYGSYVHGIFDDGDIAVRIVQALADKKRVSWKPEAGGDYHAFKEQQYDKLAQGLREHLDMEYVYSILQESRISS